MFSSRLKTFLDKNAEQIWWHNKTEKRLGAHKAMTLRMWEAPEILRSNQSAKQDGDHLCSVLSSLFNHLCTSCFGGFLTSFCVSSFFYSDAEEEGELEPAKELIQPIAEKLMVKYKAKEEETPLLFFVAGEVR